MKTVISVGTLLLLLVAVATPAKAACTERCFWIQGSGGSGYACLTGTEGTGCISWGDVCAIMTGCKKQVTLIQPNGTVLAVMITETCKTQKSGIKAG